MNRYWNYLEDGNSIYRVEDNNLGSPKQPLDQYNLIQDQNRPMISKDHFESNLFQRTLHLFFFVHMLRRLCHKLYP